MCSGAVADAEERRGKFWWAEGSIYILAVEGATGRLAVDFGGGTPKMRKREVFALFPRDLDHLGMTKSQASVGLGGGG